jgi:hypothetical protein
VPATIPLNYSAVYVSIFTFQIPLCEYMSFLSSAPSQYPQTALELWQSNSVSSPLDSPSKAEQKKRKNENEMKPEGKAKMKKL